MTKFTQYGVPVVTGIVLFALITTILSTINNTITAVIIGLIAAPLGIYIDNKFIKVA
jgi:hypothetical protein